MISRVWTVETQREEIKGVAMRVGPSDKFILCNYIIFLTVKLAFHDADTDSDSPDTSIHPYV